METEFFYLNAIILIYVCVSLYLPVIPKLHTGEGTLANILTGHLIFRYSGAEAPVFIPKRIHL